MNMKWTAAFGVLGAALVVFIASASTPMRQPVPAVAVPKPAPVDLQGAELAAEIAKLRDRLRPSAEPRMPARNLFRYRAATRSTDVRPTPPSAPVPEPAARPVFVPARPPVDLVGIAEDGAPDAPVRTAILNVLGQLTLVKVGDAVTAGYRVTSISSQDVLLTDPESGATLRFSLK